MINNNKLIVLDFFEIDNNLKKHKELNNNFINNSGNTGLSVGIGIPTISRNGNGRLSFNGNEFEENLRLVQYLEYIYSQNRTIINWTKLKFAKTFLSNNERTRKHIKYDSIQKFFDEIHNQIKVLDVEEKSIKFYEDAIKNASDNGQHALVEMLVSKKDVIIFELKLVASKMKINYVTEEDVVKFYKKSNLDSTKTLKLSWIKNYLRTIPDDVIEKKKQFDELCVFDNYVVLHFDKNNDSTELTEKEKEKAKDPILFGLIANSDKLYFIGDWIDEYCDLTINKFIKVLEQKKVKELTAKSIKSELNKQKND